MKNTKYKKWCDPKWWHFQLKIVPKWLDACISMPSLFCDCIMRTELKCRYLNDINWHNNKSLTLCTVYFGHWTHKSKTTRHALTSKRAWHKKKHKYYKSYYNLIDWIDSKVLSNCSLPKKINMRKMLYFWGHTPSHPSGFFLSMEFFIFRLICRLHLGVMTVRERAHITYRKTEKMWPKRCETTISWSPQSLAAEHHFFLLLFVADTFFPILEETKGTKPNSKHIFSSSAGSMFWMFKHTTYSNCFWCKCTYHSIRSVHLTMTKHEFGLWDERARRNNGIRW